jgi:predicted acyl esterase
VAHVFAATKSIGRKNVSKNSLRQWRAAGSKKLHSTVAALALAVAAVSSGAALAEDANAMLPGNGSWQPSEAQYGVMLEENKMIAMSDGTKLEVSVAYPTNPSTGEKAEGNFPVLLTQTPYLGVPASGGNYFVERGYIYVTASVRGTRESGGKFLFFSDRDAQDGADLVNWAANDLAGSDGSVGLHGNSYMGLTQIFTMAALGKGSPVKAIAPSCMGSELYREVYFVGGIPTQTFNFQRVIGFAMGQDTWESGEAYMANVSSSGDIAFDGDYWVPRNSGNFAQAVAETEVPVLLWSTNNDIYAQSSLELYAYLQNAHAGRPVFSAMSPSDEASGRYQVVMAHGGHCQAIENTIQIEWFDTWLKGADTGIADTKLPLHAREMVSNEWVNLAAFPPVPVYTQYFLQADGSLATEMEDSASKTEVPYQQPTDDNKIVFDAPAFTEATAIAGPMSATFYASSNTPDLTVVATLEVVDADGNASHLTAGTVLASMAELDPDRSWYDANGVPTRPYAFYDEMTPIDPGTVGRYDFTLSTRFAEIPAGSHLRLVLTSQTTPDACKPSLGVDPCFPTNPQLENLEGSIATLHYGPEHPSSINLPIVGGDCFVSYETEAPYWGKDPALGEDGVCQLAN